MTFPVERWKAFWLSVAVTIFSFFDYRLGAGILICLGILMLFQFKEDKSFLKSEKLLGVLIWGTVIGFSLFTSWGSLAVGLLGLFISVITPAYGSTE